MPRAVSFTHVGAHDASSFSLHERLLVLWEVGVPKIEIADELVDPRPVVLDRVPAIVRAALEACFEVFPCTNACSYGGKYSRRVVFERGMLRR